MYDGIHACVCMYLCVYECVCMSVCVHARALILLDKKRDVVIVHAFIKEYVHICMSLFMWMCSGFFAPPWIRLSVCVSVRLCLWTNSSQTDQSIWTLFSLNGCLPHWLEPYWNWWPKVKDEGHSTVVPIFSSWFSVNVPTLYLSFLMFNQSKIQCIALIYPWSICF